MNSQKDGGKLLDIKAESPRATPVQLGDSSSFQPLSIIEDADTGHRFVIYTTKDGVRLDLRFDGVEPWFTQLQVGQMFGVDLRTANHHIRRFLEEGELSEGSIRKFEIVRQEGARRVKREIEHCGLDAAFYVGYRVNSREGKLFRRWATNMLVQLATKGFVVDVRRMEAPAGPDHFEELLEKIRHIRASERRMWTRILELASFCSDYGAMTEADRQEFFSTIQNAMHWAITQRTAAEVIYERVDAAKPNAGVVHFAGYRPTVREAQTAKNYYSDMEIEALNFVTGMTLEFFESQAEQRRTTTLRQFLDRMCDLLKLDGRPVLREDREPSVSPEDAKKRASAEIRIFNELQRIEREEEGERELYELGIGIKAKKASRAKAVRRAS